MKLAIYARVSTQEQTVENQLIRLTEYCEKHKYSFVTFKEKESTRKTRPVKQELLTRLRNKEFDGVIVYSLSRWARSSTELILEIQELVDKGIAFISYSESLDFSTATGKLHFQILSAFAEFERSLISERTKEGIRRAKKEGKRVGRPTGSKDSKPRKNEGYLRREALKRESNNPPLK